MLFRSKSENVKNKADLKKDLTEKAIKAYEAKEAEFGDPAHIRELERVVLLKVIDNRWMNHIDDMDQLKQGIGLQSFAQRDPVVEYKVMGYDMFDEMLCEITEETIKSLMHVQAEHPVEREDVGHVHENEGEEVSLKTIRREGKKIRPNDPCPCGSGKKYKQCCGKDGNMNEPVEETESAPEEEN